MAETFRKARIEHYIHRLQIRKDSLKQQIDDPDLKDLQAFMKGQYSAINLILSELTDEFELSQPLSPQIKKMEGFDGT